MESIFYLAITSPLKFGISPWRTSPFKLSPSTNTFEQSYATCTRMTVFSTSLSAPLVEMEGLTVCNPSHVLTASYNNYFHIFDVATRNDVILQADKSAFKAKRAGSTKNKAVAPARKNRKDEYANLDAVDFHKKILHASWHPRENTIALAATNNLFLFNQSFP